MHIGGFACTQPPTDPYGPLYPRPIAQLDGAAGGPHFLSAQDVKRIHTRPDELYRRKLLDE